jgi:Family of unknown function (DUF5684)
MISLFSTPLIGSILTRPLLAQETEYSTSYSTSGQVSPMFLIAWGVVMLLMLAAMWKMFTKAGQPGWAILIPIYNLYVMCKIAGRPGWWLLLMLIPFVNFIVAIILYVDIAKNFGNGAGFAIGMLFLPFVFFPILGFGSAQYQGAVA